MRAAFLLAWLALLSGPAYAASTSTALSVVIGAGVAGTVAWYSFDTGTISRTTVTDMTGNGNTGTEIGSPAVVAGTIGQALSFNGSSQAVTLLQPTALNFRGQTSAFSIMAWIKTSSPSTNGNEMIVSKADANNRQFRLYTAPGGVLAADTGDSVPSIGTKNLRDGAWHHVAMTVPASSSGLLIYVDRAVEPLTSGTGAIGNVSIAKDILIGARRNTSNSDLLRVFNGAIDEVRFYPRVLSQSEIQAVFGKGAPVGTTMLLGLFGGENQGFSSCIHVTNCTQPNGYAGRFPDFTEDQSYMGPGGGDPSHWDLGYPFVAGFSTVDNQPSADGTRCGGYNDMAAAARGDYDSVYQAVINNGLIGGPGRPYAIRINWEWDAWWFCASPWPYESCCHWDENSPKWTPAIWIGAVRRFVGLVRATPGLENVKIEWDGPSNATEAAYYPGDDVIDLIGTDMYFNQLYDGDDPLGSWNRHIDMLNYKSAFAAAHNKPMFIGEWCDTYADGSNIPRFAAWMKANNVVGHVYWNTDLDIGAPAGCSLARSDAPARKAAYIAAFGGTSYQGTYWPMPLLTLPAGNPMEY